MKISIKRGRDLTLRGAIIDNKVESITPRHVAIYPEDFHGFIAKVDVKVGDLVNVGTPIFHDKNVPELQLTSPVSGEIIEVERGERRRLIKVVIANDNKYTSDKIVIPDNYNDKDSLLKILAQSGLMAHIHRRPYDVVARPSDNPRDIFITAFDSSPLAYTSNYDTEDVELMARAVNFFHNITTGNIYISRRYAEQLPDIPGAKMVDVKGPHPAGNIGIQIANIAPINKGENIWALSTDTLRRIGYMLVNKQLDTKATVALTGSRVKTPMLIKTIIGASMAELLNGRLDEDNHHRRIISGNVLTGVKVDMEGHLRFPYTHISVIPEGDDVDEFMGWASFSPSKMSVNPSYPGKFFKKLFNPDARILGGRRAMIMSGLIDSVLPMDIMGEYLIKAAKSHDIDAMEQLGIYEVAPEDFALAECLDSSKMPYQAIIRESLDYLRGELE